MIFFNFFNYNIHCCHLALILLFINVIEVAFFYNYSFKNLKSQQMEIAQINFEYQKEMDQINSEHRKEMDQINSKYQKEMDQINSEYQKEMDRMDELQRKIAKLSTTEKEKLRECFLQMVFEFT